jgi:hypothetical protein
MNAFFICRKQSLEIGVLQGRNNDAPLLVFVSINGD